MNERIFGIYYSMQPYEAAKTLNVKYTVFTLFIFHGKKIVIER